MAASTDDHDALTSSPACVVLDARAGLDVLRQWRKKSSITPVIVLGDRGDVATAVQAMKAGAADFVEKTVDDSLASRIRAAIDRFAEVRKLGAQVDLIDQRIGRLTPRERQVMDLVVAGLHNRGIGEQLGVTEKTIEVHRGRAMAKMEADSVAELVRMVLTWRMHGDERR